MTDFLRLRVLLVEDELLIALAVEDMLRDMGCEVIGPAFSLAEAEELARESAIDGALLDVNVRGQLVFPVAELLERRGIPVILCSGYATTRVIPPPFDALPQLAKPYDQAMLERAMARTFLNARKPPREASDLDQPEEDSLHATPR